MARLEIVEATCSHVLAMVDRLREADKEEISSATGEDANVAMFHSYRKSFLRWTALMDDRPIAVFGVAPMTLMGTTGIVWLLGTDDASKAGARLARATKKCVMECLGMFKRLENYVDDRNELSKKWIKWLGFTIENPAPYGVERRLFRHFYMERA
jgi:hypothetical protein